jgi:hypothetical protein
LNSTAPRWERLRTRSSPHGVNNSPHPARLDPSLELNQGDPPCSFPPRPPGPRQGWAAGSDRFWLLELRVSRTFLDQLRPKLFRPWIPNSARHRRWTPMIHRGRARRTISAGSWFGQWSPDPPVLCDRSSPSPRPLARHVETSAQPNGGSRRPSPNESPTVGASPGNLRSAERRGQETTARTSAINPKRKENVRQPQLCSMPASPSRSLQKVRAS